MYHKIGRIDHLVCFGMLSAQYMTVSTYFIIGLLRGGQLFQEGWFFVLYLYVRLYFLLTL